MTEFAPARFEVLTERHRKAEAALIGSIDGDDTLVFADAALIATVGTEHLGLIHPTDRGYELFGPTDAPGRHSSRRGRQSDRSAEALGTGYRHQA